MGIEVWSTRQPIPRDFAFVWKRRLAVSHRANFSMSVEYLQWQARHGEPAHAVLLDDGARRGAMVLREEGGELVCGWPWRWQMVLEEADPSAPTGMTTADAAWFCDAANHVAGRHRLRFYSPHDLHDPLTGYPAGGTILIDLAHATENQLSERMDRDVRRRSRLCARDGYEVREDCTVADERVFAALVNDTHERRHHLHAGAVAQEPAPGEDWRTWEQPWHLLLVVVRNQEMVAGLGIGRHPGGTVEARVIGSTEAALRDGVDPFVVWEAVRRSRLAGHTWFNFGGATTFKKKFGGCVVPIYCRIGGGVEWLAPNVIEGCARRALAWRASLARGHVRHGAARH